MKRMNLDESWKLCMSMWRWIAEQIRAGCEYSVDVLKEQWLKKHGYKIGKYGEYITGNCFFCTYITSCGKEECSFCPGKKVDGTFNCMRKDYDFFGRPIAFYNKLRSLNRKRLKK